MTILITPDELEEEFRNSWKMGHISQPSIDYDDNTIYGIFEGKMCIIFRFKDFGWVNDNRFNYYTISSGNAGIFINIFRN